MEDAVSTDVDAEDHNCLRNRLIRRTVAGAWEGSSYYRKLYQMARVDPDTIETIADLPRLPVVRKPDIRRAGRDARCYPEKAQVSHIQHTSGTTGEPLFVYRGVRESRFISEFFSRLAQERREHMVELPLTLVLSGMDWHGTPTSIPGNAFPIHCAMLSESCFPVAVDLLERDFEIPGTSGRVRALTASNELLTFTSWCLERGVDCRRFEVEAIQLTGFYLTTRWRRLLADTWGAAVIDRYTMAEHFGGATRVSPDDGFRFDPHIAYELADFVTHQPVADRPGMMLLTSLSPFVQLQPLIRYWTADVFEAHPASREGAPAFEFLGRESQALFHPGDPGQLLLSGVDTIEALDAFPDVARTNNFRERSDLAFQGADGYPVFGGTVDRDGGKYRFALQVALTTSPHVFPGRARALADSMREAVLARATKLAGLVEAGEAELTVEHVPPGSLEVSFGSERERLEVAPLAWRKRAYA